MNKKVSFTFWVTMFLFYTIGIYDSFSDVHFKTIVYILFVFILLFSGVLMVRNPWKLNRYFFAAFGVINASIGIFASMLGLMLVFNVIFKFVPDPAIHAKDDLIIRNALSFSCDSCYELREDHWLYEKTIFKFQHSNLKSSQIVIDKNQLIITDEDGHVKIEKF